MPLVNWVNTEEVANPTNVQIINISCGTSSSSTITVNVSTNIPANVSGTTTPATSSEGPTPDGTLHQLTFTGMSSSTTYTVNITAANASNPGNTDNGSTQCGTTSSSGNFSITSDLTLLDPEGTPMIVKGANFAAGNHTNPGSFTTGKATNLNNKNYPQVSLNGWTTTGTNPTGDANLLALQTYWPGWNCFRINMSSEDPGMVNWPYDPELQRIITHLTDNKMICMIENHISTGDDPTAAEISNHATKWGQFAQWCSQNLTNPEYVWVDVWNEPGGGCLGGSTYCVNNNGGNVTHDSAWVDWHAPVCDAFLNHLPDNMLVWEDTKTGTGLNHSTSAWVPDASCLSYWLPQVMDGTVAGVPPGGYPNIMGQSHVYQRHGGPNGGADWDTIGVQICTDQAADLKAKGVYWHVGEIGGNDQYLEPQSRLNGDEEGTRAWFTVKPDGIGVLWWGGSVSWNTGYAVHNIPDPTIPGRIPMWHFSQTVLNQAEHGTNCRIELNGLELWNWFRNPPALTP